jgi:hypothetical protein
VSVTTETLMEALDRSLEGVQASGAAERVEVERLNSPEVGGL